MHACATDESVQNVANVQNASRSIVLIWFLKYWVHMHACATDESDKNVLKKCFLAKNVVLWSMGNELVPSLL